MPEPRGAGSRSPPTPPPTTCDPSCPGGATPGRRWCGCGGSTEATAARGRRPSSRPSSPHASGRRLLSDGENRGGAVELLRGVLYGGIDDRRQAVDALVAPLRFGHGEEKQLLQPPVAVAGDRHLLPLGERAEVGQRLRLQSGVRGQRVKGGEGGPAGAQITANPLERKVVLENAREPQ